MRSSVPYGDIKKAFRSLSRGQPWKADINCSRYNLLSRIKHISPHSQRPLYTLYSDDNCLHLHSVGLCVLCFYETSCRSLKMRYLIGVTSMISNDFSCPGLLSLIDCGITHGIRRPLVSRTPKRCHSIPLVTCRDLSLKVNIITVQKVLLCRLVISS